MATTLHLGDCSTDCALCVANCNCKNCSILCGGCGEYMNETEQDENGFHLPKLCPAQDELTHEETHLALLEDFSNVIRKHLPTFDNNISADTWKLLELFADETINQLTKEIK
jgi:hypothetical protein